MKAIVTKYLPATNSKGARIKANSASVKSVTLPWDYSLDTKANHARAALELCHANAWNKPDIAPVIDGNTGFSFCY